MSKQEFFIYDGERLTDDGMTPTTVIAASRMARLALLSPEVMGAQNEVMMHEPDGRKYPAPRGGFLGRNGYEATHLDTEEDELMLEVTPRMGAEDITAFGDFLGDKMVATGLLAPWETGVRLHDFSDGQYTVTQVAEPRPRPTLDSILAGMQAAHASAEEQITPPTQLAPALAAVSRELPAA